MVSTPNIRLKFRSQKGKTYDTQVVTIVNYLVIVGRVGRERLRGVVANEQDCRNVVSEFVFQSRYYVHFRANTLG